MKFNLYSLALGLVFFIFGLWQIINPGYWIAYLPLFLKNFDPILLFRLNGIFNFIVGLALIFSFYPLIFSFLAAFHLILVIFSFGIFNDIAIRDFGLLILALAIFLEKLKKNKNS